MNMKRFRSGALLGVVITTITFFAVVQYVRTLARNESMGTRIWGRIESYSSRNGQPPQQMTQLLNSGLLSEDERDFVIEAMHRTPPILSYNYDPRTRTAELTVTIKDTITSPITWKREFSEKK